MPPIWITLYNQGSLVLLLPNEKRFRNALDTWDLGAVGFFCGFLFVFCYYANVVLPPYTVAWICPMVLLVMSQAGL